MLNGLVDRLLHLPGWLVLMLAGSAVFAEDALFVGFVVPGETVAVLEGVAAKLGHVPLAAVFAVFAVVIVAAIAGDSVGYEVGRRLGPRLLRTRLLAARRGRIENAQRFLARRGGAAIFLGRWTAFLRAVMPALACKARMRYGTFLAYNALGGLAWGATVVALGYAAGASYAQAERAFGRYAALGAIALLGVVLTVWRIRRHRAGHAPCSALSVGRHAPVRTPTGQRDSAAQRPVPEDRPTG